MTYEKVKNLTSEKLKRLCGVKKETFAQMVEIVENQEKLKTKTGRPSLIKSRKSSIDDFRISKRI